MIANNLILNSILYIFWNNAFEKTQHVSKNTYYIGSIAHTVELFLKVEIKIYVQLDIINISKLSSFHISKICYVSILIRCPLALSFVKVVEWLQCNKLLWTIIGLLW